MYNIFWPCASVSDSRVIDLYVLKACDTYKWQYKICVSVVLLSCEGYFYSLFGGLHIVII